MADKFLVIGSTGFPTEKEATVSSAGAEDAGKIPALGSDGKLDSTLMPNGIGGDSASRTAGEAIAAGNLVYLSGTGTIMKADGTAVAKAAIGFSNVGISNGVSGNVNFEGTITGLSGLTTGAKYFLSDTAPGGVSLFSGLAGGAGKIAQFIGTAISATEITFEPGEPIVRA